jgi:hypothetical protein
MATYVQFLRGEATDELLRHPNAFTLLALIAQRARREVPQINPHGLKIGEAMVGDPGAVGLTRQEFRTALVNLQKWGLITTRATNKGTIAMLSNSIIYDINLPSTQPSTQPADNHQPNQSTTTNKNERNKEDKNLKEVEHLQEGLEAANAALTARKQTGISLRDELGKLKARKPAAQTNFLPTDFQLPEWADEEFLTVYFGEWLPYRQGKREKLKPPSIQKQLNQLSQYDSGFCRLLIDKAIAGGYSAIAYDDTPAKYEIYKSNQKKPFNPLNGNPTNPNRPQPAGLIADTLADDLAACRALGLN